MYTVEMRAQKNIVQHTVYVNEITENTVMRELTEALEMDEKCRDQFHFFWKLTVGTRSLCWI